MASAAMTREAACPKRVSVDMTRHDWIKTAPVDTTQLKTALLAGTCGLYPRDPSQWRAGGLG